MESSSLIVVLNKVLERCRDGMVSNSPIWLPLVRWQIQGLQVLLVWLDVSKWHGMTWVWLLWLSVVGVVHGMDWLVWLGVGGVVHGMDWKVWLVGLSVGGVVPCIWMVWLCLWDLGGS